MSEERRQPVRNGTGQMIGRVVDFVIHLADEPGAPAAVAADPDAHHPRVRALIVQPGRDGRLRLPWHLIDSFDHTEVRCRPDAPAVDPSDGDSGLIGPGELLLVRDVLDTQVVDLDRHRLTRVGDVLLTRAEEGTLRVAAVEVGVAPVLRRLGLGRVTDRRTQDVIDWDDLHLTSARGHEVQLTTPAAAVHRLSPPELNELLHRLSTDAGTDVLAALSPERAAATVDTAQADLGARLVGALTEDEAEPVFAALPVERAHRLRALRRRAVPRRRYLRHRRRRPRGNDGSRPGTP